MNAAPDWRGLRHLLNKWDPIGVAPELGGPDDEYDCMLGPLLTLLSGGGNEGEVGSFLRKEVSGHFGLDPNYSQPERFAARVMAWWAIEQDASRTDPGRFAADRDESKAATAPRAVADGDAGRSAVVDPEDVPS